MMGKVEAEALRLNQRTLLPDMMAQALAQYVVDQVRGAVIALDVVAPGGIDRRMERLRLESIGKGSTDHRPLGVLANHVHRERPALPGQRTGVTHLSARFDVERVFLQH